MSSNRSSNRTLNRQLVVRITLIVTLVTLGVAVVSTVLVWRILSGNLDEQLRYAVHASEDRPHGPGHGPGMMGEEEGLRVGGLPSGSIWLVQSPNGVQASVIWASGSARPPTEQINALLALPVDGNPRTIDLGELGRYRAVAHQTSSTMIAAAAAPLAVTESVIARMIGIEVILIALAAAAAGGISTVVVRNSLRPLNQLATTASQVAALPLESGEVALGVRVPDEQTDEGSEVGRVGVAFNSMLDHVEASLQARHDSETRVRQFVADASHELRNPLAAIRGYAELTRLGRDRLPDDTVFALGRIDAESQRMSRLVEQLLLLARLDNAPEPATTPVDLTEIVLNVAADTRAAGPDHRWLVEAPDEPLVVLGDTGQLHQLAANLLGNARKHTPPGSTVRTSLAARDGWVVLEVADDGPGIAPEAREHIFERFTKADVARAHDAEGSTGLGLAIVEAVAKAHRGRVEVASQQASDQSPGWTRFTVWLPLAANAG